MNDITIFAMCIIFAYLGAACMYQWLSTPRTQEEKDRELKKGIVILIGVLILLGVIPFIPDTLVPKTVSHMLKKHGLLILALILCFRSLFVNRHAANKTPEEEASARRIGFLVMIGTIILLVFCSIIWFPFL